MSSHKARSWAQHLSHTLNRRLLIWGCPRWLRALLVILVALVSGTALFGGTALLLMVLWAWSVPELRTAWASGALSFGLACKLVVLITIGRVMLGGQPFLAPRIPCGDNPAAVNPAADEEAP